MIRRMLANPTTSVGGLLCLVVFLGAVLAPWIAPYDPTDQNIIDRLQSPNAEYWLGTDTFGRDILSRILWGARISLVVAVASTAAAIVVGGAIGMISGYVGGRLDLSANSMSVVRISGQDVQRATLRGEWARSWLTGLGQRVTGTVLLRGDLYNTTDRIRATLPNYRGNEGFQTRGIAAAAVDAEWPFSGPALGGTQTITPHVQIVAAPLNLNRGVPNEDSRSNDFEDTNLFVLNRFSGFDRFESGTHLSYGLQYGLTRAHFRFSSEIGASVRLDGVGTGRFLAGTGLSGQFSDIVGRNTLQYGSLLSITQRFRIDSRNGNVRRNEIDIAAGNSQTYLTVGYAYLNRNILLEDLRDFQEVRAGARVALSRFWSAYGTVIIDLTTKSQERTTTANGYQPIRHRIGLQYEDSCFRLGATWRRDYTSDRDFRAGDSYIFTIAFKNLGR